MPTRRRDATMPIDSSTRIASRATLRDTAYSRPMPSSVSTWPGASSPDDDPAAERVEDAGVQAGGRGTAVSRSIVSSPDRVARKNLLILAQTLAKYAY